MQNTEDNHFMNRCLTIAKYGQGKVKSNPMVGSIVVHDGKIIAEGYHAYYGGDHAERMALLNVPPHFGPSLEECTLYVTLEPCNHHGKTPPCVDLIIEKKIGRVVVCQEDPNPLMQGKSIELLKKANIKVTTGILADRGHELNKQFIVNQKLNLPFVTLKLALSQNQYIGKQGEQIWLSNEVTKHFVHRLRSQMDAVMVGTNTAIIDNPQLNNRSGTGSSPIRVIIDWNGRIPNTHHLVCDGLPTIVYTGLSDYKVSGTNKIVRNIKSDERINLKWVLEDLYEQGISSLLIEGGAQLAKSVINEKLWHEAIIIQTNHPLNEGIKAPVIKGIVKSSYDLEDNKILKINPLKMDKNLI